jgi:hypothetical protein
MAMSTNGIACLAASRVGRPELVRALIVKSKPCSSAYAANGDLIRPCPLIL